MKREDAIKQIKVNLKKLLRFTEEKFGTLVLSDGTNISISSSDLEIGAEIFMLDDLGNQTPCENGDYVLQDGRTFTVTDGKVSDIKATETSPEKPESGDTTTTKPETMGTDGLPEGHTGEQSEEDKPEKDAQVDGDLASRVESLEKQIAEVLNILSKMGDSQNELNEQMMKAIQKFGAEPGAEPIKFGKKGNQPYQPKKHNDATFEEFKEIMKQRRKMSN